MCVCVIDFIFTPLSLSSLSLFPSLSTSLVPCFFLRSSVLTPRTLDWQQANPDSTIPLEERQYHCHIGNIIQNNQTTITKVSGHYNQQKKDTDYSQFNANRHIRYHLYIRFDKSIFVFVVYTCGLTHQHAPFYHKK